MSLINLKPLHNNLALKISTAPTQEPVELDEMKEYLRQDHDAEDNLIKDILIPASRRIVEEYTRRSLISQTWDMFLDFFPGGNKALLFRGVQQSHINQIRQGDDFIIVPRSPLISVTSISTFADDNTETTFASSNYIVDAESDPGRILLNRGSVWPDNLREYHAVKVVFVAGYGTTKASVPEDIRTAVKMVCAQLYEHRGDEEDKTPTIPKAAKFLLKPYVVHRLG